MGAPEEQIKLIREARRVLETITRNRGWFISIEYVSVGGGEHGTFILWPNTVTYRDAKERELILKLLHGRVGGKLVGPSVLITPDEAIKLEADSVDEMSAEGEE